MTRDDSAPPERGRRLIESNRTLASPICENVDSAL